MSNENSVSSLIAGVESQDPRLYDLLKQLADDVYKINNYLFPPGAVSAFGATGQILLPTQVTGFTATIFTNNLRLTWNLITNASYELRYQAGNLNQDAWNTASTVLRTNTLSADINPLTIPLIFGYHTFLIKAIDSNGNYSDTASYTVVNVPAISAPSISPTTIENFVLLNWTTPTSIWQLDHYNVYKNSSLVGTVSGTFEAIFETVGGIFTYEVEPVDIVGNIGTRSPAVTLNVQNPVDFTLHATLTSNFNGTKTSCYAFTDETIV